MSPIEEYIEKIESGEIIVCKKIHRLYVEILKPIVQGKDARFYFDPKPGQMYTDFCFKLCKQSKAPFAGKPLELMLWQKAKYDALLGIKWRSTGLRRFTECFNVVSRKNGKSTDLSAFDLYMLRDCHGAEVYTVATELAQARHLWDEAVSMVDKSEWLRRHFTHRVFPTPEILLPEFDSSFKVLSNNPDKQDGLNVSAASIDEAHELKRTIYDVIKQGTATRQQPIIYIITTAGFVRTGFFDDEYAFATQTLNDPDSCLWLLPIIYEMDSRDEIYNENLWIKANPGIGVIKTFQYLRDQVARAKIDPNYMATVLVKDFDIIGVQGLSYMTIEEINRGAFGPYTQKEIEDPKFLDQFDGSMVIGAYDLSKTTDITAFVILLFDPKKMCIVIKPMFWITKGFLKSDLLKADKSAPVWPVWIQKGFVRVCDTTYVNPEGQVAQLGESTINYHEITDYISDEFQKHNYIFAKIMYDPWSATYLKYDIASRGWSCDTKGSTQEGVPQSFKYLSLPTGLFESYMKDGRICYLNNPVFKWMLTNCSTVTDDNGNIMLKKADFKSMKKIDGPACTVDGFAEIAKNQDIYFMPREE